jgi:hypothetical protein
VLASPSELIPLAITGDVPRLWAVDDDLIGSSIALGARSCVPSPCFQGVDFNLAHGFCSHPCYLLPACSGLDILYDIINKSKVDRY